MIRTHKWSNRWGIPGGKIKRGETCEAALRREVMEETSLELGEIHFIMAQDCIEPPEFERSAHFLLLNYIARCLDDDAPITLNDEAEESQWLPLGAALNLQLNRPTRVLIEEAIRQGFLTHAP